MADGGNDGIAAARAALSRGESALIWRRQIADTDTPISAALKLFEPDRGDYLLESVEGGDHLLSYDPVGITTKVCNTCFGWPVDVRCEPGARSEGLAVTRHSAATAPAAKKNDSRADSIRAR